MSFDLIKYDGKAIRMVGTPGKPEWVAADVCQVLGISEPQNTLRSFKPTERGRCTVYTPPGGQQEMLTVTEPGLYRLIFKSRKPDAEKFRMWVTHEVLPSIRKHGCYPPPLVESGTRAIVDIDHESVGLQIGKYVAIGFRDELRKTVNEEVKPIRNDIENFKTEVCTRLDSFERRKSLTQKTRRTHRYILNQFYGGKCPCCKQVLIVNSALQELAECEGDHWISKAENNVKDTWLVCKKCNSKLRDRDFKQQSRVHFDAYQGHRKEFRRALESPILPGFET